MLINLLFNGVSSYAQSGLDAPVTYEARDSIVANVPKQIVTLYGEARVEYDGIELTADIISIDLKSNDVTATFSLDSAGNPVGKPLFSAEGEETKCDLIKYNFKTKKGYVKEVRAQQDEGYIHMSEAKIHPNEQIHLKHGKFTTCENDTPHYHFRLSKAVIVPDERIVTGPVNMKIFKVPTPLALPFAFFPNSESRKHGIILPEFASSTQYGFGLQDFGYYIPLGDYFDTQFNASLFTTGRFAIGNITNYYRKYKYRGSLNLRFEQLRGRFYDEDVLNKFTVRWSHAQDVKAHPSIKFSASINYTSDNNGKTTLATYNPDYFNNTFNSSIKLSKSWKTRKFRGSWSVNNSLQQNSASSRYNIELPAFNLSVSQFDLGVFRKNQIGSKWYENINVRYGMNAANTISIADSVFNELNFPTIADHAINGIKHDVTVNSNIKLLGNRFTFTPSATYSELWNFQYERHELNTTDWSIDTTEIDGFGTARSLSFSGGFGFSFYGLYKFKGQNKTRFKHVALNSLSFTFKPDISSFERFEIDTSTTGADPIVYNISPFNGSRYKEAGFGESGSIRWSTSNSVKMKTRDKKDTINEIDKTFNVIDALSWSGSYDIFKDSFQLSAQTFQFRTAKLFNIFSFQSSATLNPYTYDSLNRVSSDYAWENNQGIGKLTRFNLTIGANFTNRNGRKKQKEISDATEDNAGMTQLYTDPNKVNWDIPWQINTSYNFDYTLAQNKAHDSLADYKLIQTLLVNGDFSINKKWKVKGGISVDLQQLNPNNHDAPDNYKYPYEDFVTSYNVEIWRDLHCWEAVISFRQNGIVRKSPEGLWTTTDQVSGLKTKYWQNTPWVFMFRVNIKASMFQDIKLEYNQPPWVF